MVPIQGVFYVTRSVHFTQGNPAKNFHFTKANQAKNVNITRVGKISQKINLCFQFRVFFYLTRSVHFTQVNPAKNVCFTKPTQGKNVDITRVGKPIQKCPYYPRGQSKQKFSIFPQRVNPSKNVHFTRDYLYNLTSQYTAQNLGLFAQNTK